MRTNKACLDDTLYPTNIIIKVGLSVKKKVLSIVLALAICASSSASAFDFDEDAITVWFDDDRFLSLTFQDIIGEEIISVRKGSTITQTMCFLIPYDGTTVTVSGWVEGEGCWNEKLIWQNGAYEVYDTVWRDWDWLPGGKPSLIFDFAVDYENDRDAYSESNVLDCYHGVYFKYVYDFRPAWFGRISAWALEEVNSAIMEGLVTEALMEKDYFLGNITRGEAAQMFINLIERVSGRTIDDFLEDYGVVMNRNAFVDSTDKAVLAANALGIINGVGNNKFDPDGILTRAQIAAVVNRTAWALDINTLTSGKKHNFTDVVGHWVAEELDWPVSSGIINGVGDNKFDPDGALTTEQAVVLIYRTFVVLLPSRM